MPMPIRSLLVVLLLSGTGAVLADAGGPADDTQAPYLYRLSGLEQQMQSVAGQILASLDRADADLPPAADGMLRQLIAEHFSEPTLRPRVLARMEDAWNPGHAAAAKRWLTGDFGRRVTDMETAAASPEGLAGLDMFAMGLLAEPLAPERMALIESLNDASGSTDFALDSSMAVSLALVSGINALLPATAQQDAGDLRRAVEQERDAAYGRTEQFLLTYGAYVYRELSDEELGRYVEFVSSDTGNWYVFALLSAATQAQLESANTFGDIVRAAQAGTERTGQGS